MDKVKIRFAYKSGFRRLWLIVSILWVIAVLWMTTRVSDSVPSEVAMTAILPPLALYLLGAAVVWVVEGFARAD